MDRDSADGIGVAHLKADHNSGDHLVANLWVFFHVAHHNVNAIPCATLHNSCGVHFFLDKEAGIEALSI